MYTQLMDFVLNYFREYRDENVLRQRIYALVQQNGIDTQDQKGKTALMYALMADFQNLKTIQILVENGANVNATDCNGKTVLMYAMEKQSFSIVRYLIEKGAKTDAIDRKGKTLWYYAICYELKYNNNYSKFNFLCQQKVVLNCADFLWLYKNYTNRIQNIWEIYFSELLPFHNETCLLEYVFNQKNYMYYLREIRKYSVYTDIDILQFVFSNDINQDSFLQFVDTIESTDDQNFFRKIFLCHVEGRFLLENVISDENCTVKLVDCLIQLGAVVTEDVLQLCFENKTDSKIVNVLIKALITDETNRNVLQTIFNRYSDHSIIRAIKDECPAELLVKMLNWGVLVDVQDEDNRTPLILAIQKEKDESVIDKIIEKTNNVNFVDNVGNTALMLAIQKGIDENIINKIMKKTNEVDLIDSYGKTVLYYAIESGKDALISELLNKEADVNIQDIDMNTPLILAIQKGIDENMIKKFIEQNVDVNFQDDNRRTALYYAIKNRNESGVGCLLDQGADVRKDILIWGFERGCSNAVMRKLIETFYQQNRLDYKRVLDVYTPGGFTIDNVRNFDEELFSQFFDLGVVNDDWAHRAFIRFTRSGDLNAIRFFLNRIGLTQDDINEVQDYLNQNTRSLFEEQGYHFR